MNDLKEQFLLDPNITFLNFGSFGASAKPIFDNYQKWQRELELNPVQFITVNGPIYLQQAREALSKYVNCHADDLVYITNPTYAVNIVAKNIGLQKDDEILTTNLEYGACDRIWEYYCEKVGAKYIQQKITFPIIDSKIFLEEFFIGITNKTKLIFISHITSATALKLPVEAMCKYASEKGILIFIDGAHAVGQVPIDLQNLNVDFYTGACHKWMMTAKGSSFFYAKNIHQKMLDPTIVSWGYKALAPSASQFLDYHQFIGTRDFSAFLTIPTALQFMHENNWNKVSEDCSNLVINNAQRFCDIVNATPISPINNEFIGQMFAIPILTKNPPSLKNTLYNKYKVEVSIMPHEDKIYLRYSIQAFNNQQDLDVLYDAINELVETKEIEIF